MIVVGKKIKKKVLREINEELENKIGGEFCDPAACSFVLKIVNPKDSEGP